jgi:TM2 domain-containing membrane protein YozV
MADGQGSTGNVIAALASFFIPGLGQLIQGRILHAALFFIVPIVGYALWWLLFIPAIIGGLVHLWSIIDAAMWKPRG